MTVNRIYPARIHISTWLMLVFGIVLVGIGILIVVLNQSIIFFVVTALFVIVGLYIIRAAVSAMRIADIFKKGSAITQAVIVNRPTQKKHVELEHGSDDYVDYQLELKFIPARSKNPAEEIKALASVTQTLYEKYTQQDELNIEYALENPAIFLIEGEK